MFSTKSVNSLKNIFASYHEPLPLSKQQSQKLLDGLKVSFRKQLDREYGESSDSLAAAPKAVGAEQFMRHSAASRHLKDILNNPLFSYNKEVSPRRLADLTPKITGQTRDPMEVFDHAVARGMMTVKAATGCMVAKRKELNGFEAPGSMAASQTASRVVQWLRSSGAEKDLSFLDDPTFVRVLTRFLVPEGMEEVAWEWLTRVVNDPSGTLDREKQLRRSSLLLAELVRTKCQYQYGNLDSAISTMLQAQQMFQSSPLLSELLVLSWRSVSWFSTVEALHRTAPSEELFEAHLATADRLPEPFLMERAHLHLHHPTHPDHLPALEFFTDEKTLGNTLHAFYGAKMKLKSKLQSHKKLGVIQWMSSLGKDTVKYLSESGRTQEAQGVTNILEAQVAGLINSAREPVG